ncbi:unnamed protein product, partial [Prorocentrum cordatum]
AFLQVAAGGAFTILVRNDGRAVACGRNGLGQCDVPALPRGLTYTQAAAGARHSVLLRSDGIAVAFGWDLSCQCDLPVLREGLTYTQVAAGDEFNIFLRSDGAAVVRAGSAPWRGYLYAQDIPCLDDGILYTQVAAGYDHAVLLRSDGTAVACGPPHLRAGACCIPPLAAGMTYTHVAAGEVHAVLLRSDGTAVACGVHVDGLRALPAMTGDLIYVAHLFPPLLLQASFDGNWISFDTLAEVHRGRIAAAATDCLKDIYDQMMAEHRAGRLGAGFCCVDAVLPGGALLSECPAGLTVASALGLRRRRAHGKRPRSAYVA